MSCFTEGEAHLKKVTHGVSGTNFHQQIHVVLASQAINIVNAKQHVL